MSGDTSYVPAAVEDASMDGFITQAERAVLDGLRDDLGIDPAEARRFEREVAGAAP